MCDGANNICLLIRGSYMLLDRYIDDSPGSAELFFGRRFKSGTFDADRLISSAELQAADREAPEIDLTLGATALMQLEAVQFSTEDVARVHLNTSDGAETIGNLLLKKEHGTAYGIDRPMNVPIARDLLLALTEYWLLGRMSSDMSEAESGYPPVEVTFTDAEWDDSFTIVSMVGVSGIRVSGNLEHPQ